MTLLPRLVNGAAIIPGTIIAKVDPAVGYAPGTPAGVVMVKHCNGTPPGQATPEVGMEKAIASVVLNGLRPAQRTKFEICKSVRGALMSFGCGKWWAPTKSYLAEMEIGRAHA